MIDTVVTCLDAGFRKPHPGFSKRPSRRRGVRPPFYEVTRCVRSG
jgi:hypothetical protein